VLNYLRKAKEAEMQRNLLLIPVLLVSGTLALPAQEISNDANPLYRTPSIRMGGITVPPITNAPFTATAVIKNQQHMPDGSVQTTRNINLIGRDSLGRTHGEMRLRVPESFQGMPPLSEVHLFDPQTRVQTVYYPATHVASRQLRPEPRQAANPSNSSNPLVQVEDLGSNIIEGFDAKGTRRTLTIPANGTGATITVVDEYWYSEDLHLNLLLLHNDPRTGVQTISLSNIQREEPAQEFFEVPQGYKIVDMTPPADVLAANGSR
jgi:hypothetical protein